MKRILRAGNLISMALPPLVEPSAPLSTEEVGRYARHVLIPQVGMEGQRRLKNARVLVVGAGGLGSPALMYLAAAGVGTIGVVDADVVETSNLQRQVVHGVADVGRPKSESAAETLASINPLVRVVRHDVRIDSTNALEIIGAYDLVLDGTDNFPTRYLVNDASLVKRIPVVHGSIFRFEGQATVFNPYVGPCYRCMIPEPPPAELAPSCSEAGVLGVLCGIIGSLQGIEAVKILLGLGETLQGRLMAYDALEQSFRTFKVHRDPNCPTCGPNAGEIVIAEYDELCMPHVVAPPAGS